MVKNYYVLTISSAFIYTWYAIQPTDRLNSPTAGTIQRSSGTFLSVAATFSNSCKKV